MARRNVVIRKPGPPEQGWSQEPNIQLAPGETYDLLDDVYSPGDVTRFDVDSGSVTGISLSGTKSELVTAAGGASDASGAMVFAVNYPDTAEVDWQLRSTGADVVWAERFPTETDALRHVAASTSATLDDNVFVPDDGVIGDGCLSQITPAGETYSGSWGRPLGPIPGDINNAGLPIAPIVQSNPTWFTTPSLTSVGRVNYRGGQFGHPDYLLGGLGCPYYPADGDFIGHDFWVQFRIKFSVGRWTDPTEPGGKICNIEQNHSNPRQEIVLSSGNAAVNTSVSPGQVVGPPPPYGSGWLEAYSDYGNNQPRTFNSENGHTEIQNGEWGPTCYEGTSPIGWNSTTPGPKGCFCWPEGVWITVLQHVTPGHVQTADTGYSVWVDWDQANNQKSNTYIPIHSINNWSLFFGTNSYVNEDPQPYGYNYMALLAFNGGANQVPSTNGYYHRIDQVICSTSMIPCPQV